MDWTVWTTKSCNLSCRYCYEHENKEIGNMNSDVEDAVLNNIKKAIIDSKEDLHTIQFHGGEPLLNFRLIKRFVEEIEGIKGQSIVKYGMTTNGTIWSSEIEEFLHKYKDSFQGFTSISIDGKYETHDKNRVYSNNEGSFSKAIETSHKMRAIFNKLRCRITVAPNTIEDLFDNIKYLVDLGFKQISVAFDSFSKEWNETHIYEIENQYNQVLNYWENEHIEVEISLVDEVINDKKKLGVCNPNKHFYIDGLIYPCTFVVGMKEYSIGDIIDGIDEKRIEKILNISSVDNNDCKKCNNKNSCTSNRCKLVNKVITGDFYTPPTINCILENIKIENINKFKNNLLVDIL